jgi:hypothetical protein
MNWRLVLWLASFGALIGVISLFGYTQGIELYLWVGIAVLCGILIRRNVPSLHFLHGFVAGTLAGVFNGIIQSAFFSFFLRHNPQVLEAMKPTGYTLTAGFILLTSPLAGVLFGMFLGAWAWVAGKVPLLTGGPGGGSAE